MPDVAVEYFLPEKLTLAAPQLPETGEVLKGAEAITAYLRVLFDDPTLHVRSVRRWYLGGQLPGRKLGREWVTTRTKLLRHFLGGRVGRSQK